MIDHFSMLRRAWLLVCFLLIIAGPGSAMAGLDSHAVLQIDEGQGGFSRPADGTGSWFAMESLGPGKWLYVAIKGHDGVRLGEVQAASTSKKPYQIGIDEPWVFFNNDGLHQTTKAPTIVSDDGVGNVVLDFSGWGVDWNGIETIPLPSGSNPGVDGDFNAPDGQAVMKCASSCEDGDTYVLNYTAIVPKDSGTNFSNVKYQLHLEGKISVPAAGSGNSQPDGPRQIDPNAPVAGDVQAALAADSRTVIDFRGKVDDPQGADTVDFSSLKFNNQCQGGNIIFIDGVGRAKYADGAGKDEDCTIAYTVRDNTGLESAEGTIFLRVRVGNIPPIAEDDQAVLEPGGSATIDLLGNDRDGDDGLDPSSVKVEAASQGKVTLGPGAVATYTPNDPGFDGVDTFTYTVKDTRGELSNVATVTVRVNKPPQAVDDAAEALRNGSVEISVLANDQDDAGLDPGSLQAASPDHGGVTVNGGVVTYTPAPGFLGTDSFTYTVADIDGARSQPATVTVTVVNAPPTAGDVDTTLNLSRESSIRLDPLSQATDPDGQLDGSTVAIVDAPAHGQAVVDGSAIVYTPDQGYIGPDSLTFTVTDADGATSEPATASITVVDASAAVLDPEAILTIDPGHGGNTKPQDGEGSWFAMEAAGPGGWIYVGVAGNEGIQLGAAQPATSSPISPSVDNAWVFFGNLGLHQTVKPVTVISDDGTGNVTLDFSGWAVTWNGIPVIPLDKRPHGGIEGGDPINRESVAVMHCANDCSLGDTYALDYTATVPAGDPSGFGNVPYVIHLEGKVVKEQPQLGGKDPNAPADVETVAISAGGERAVLGAEGSKLAATPGLTAQALGIPTGVGISAADLGLPDPSINPESGKQCLGGCVDFLSPVPSEGDAVEAVFKLDEPITDGADFRVYVNGKWQTFNTSAGDQIGSAPLSGGGKSVSNGGKGAKKSESSSSDGKCTDASGAFDPGLKVGNRCVYLKVQDGGPNDGDQQANGKVGILGGVRLPGEPNRPPGSSSGCSMTGDPVSLAQRADWLLIALFLSWLGLVRRIRRRML